MWGAVSLFLVGPAPDPARPVHPLGPDQPPFAPWAYHLPLEVSRLLSGHLLVPFVGLLPHVLLLLPLAGSEVGNHIQVLEGRVGAQIPGVVQDPVPEPWISESDNKRARSAFLLSFTGPVEELDVLANVDSTVHSREDLV